MCGIVAFLGKNKDSVYDPMKIKLLMVYNESRGSHSSGIYSLNNGLIKKVGKTTEKFINEIELKPDRLLIGHTRQSTGGSHTEDNAHPFEKENLILVHNGTIRNIGEICNNEPDFEYDFDKVDSKYCLDLFVKYKNPKEVIPKLYGIANFVIHDKDKPDTLYIYKHKERPLFRGESEEGMYISSIEDSLKAIGCTKITEFADEYFYTIQDGKIKPNPSRIKMKDSYVHVVPGRAENKNWKKYAKNRLVKYTGTSSKLISLFNSTTGSSSTSTYINYGQYFLVSIGLNGELDPTMKIYTKYDEEDQKFINESTFTPYRDFEFNVDFEEGDLAVCRFKHDALYWPNVTENVILEQNTYCVVLKTNKNKEWNNEDIVYVLFQDYVKYCKNEIDRINVYMTNEAFLWVVDKTTEYSIYTNAGLNYKTTDVQMLIYEKTLAIEKQIEADTDQLITDKVKNKNSSTTVNAPLDSSLAHYVEESYSESNIPKYENTVEFDNSPIYDKNDIVMDKHSKEVFIVLKALYEDDINLGSAIELESLRDGRITKRHIGQILIVSDDFDKEAYIQYSGRNNNSMDDEEEFEEDVEEKDHPWACFMNLIQKYHKLNDCILTINPIATRMEMTRNLNFMKDSIINFGSSAFSDVTEDRVEEIFNEELEKLDQKAR